MSKVLSGASLLLSAGAAAGIVFASVQMGRLSGSLERVDARLSALEKSAGLAPSGESRDADGSAADPAAAPKTAGTIETLGDAIREVRKLRDEVSLLQERNSPPPSGTAADAGGRTSAGGPDGAAAAASDQVVLRKAIEDVLAAREQERAEADRKRAAEWAKARLERTLNDLTEKLQLNGAQRDEIAKILTAASEKQQELWANRKEGENPWEKMQAIRRDQDAAAKALLTAEQQAKYDEVMRFQGGPRGGMVIEGGGPGGPGGGGPPPR